MIGFTTDLPEYRNDLCDIIRLFYDEPIGETGDGMIVHRHIDDGDRWMEKYTFGEACFEHTAPAVRGGLAEKRLVKRAAKTGLFLLLCAQTGIRPPWGSLTGIRPTRLMYELLSEGLSPTSAAAAMEERFFVASEKAELLLEIIDMQRGIYEVPDDRFDLYIGIPFCTTRCAYCSFASGELGDGRMVKPYLDALAREMDGAAALMRERNMRVRAAYVGGGTPTALTADQLSEVLDRAMARFPGAAEWTVEAGRPDTIDRAKLRAMKARGVTRISVNPQTFSDETLMRIGRAHSAKQAVDAFRLAREEGFDDINMDLIAALPGEDVDDFLRSLGYTIELSPESVTVHTLAIKRASRLHEHGYRQIDAESAARMVEIARHRLTEAGYRPYYLYRQKYMAGNLENVGYALNGKACLYNVGNMEETARVLALGAGAITKWLFPRERRIERAPNVRDVPAYVERVDEMVERKRALINT